MSDEIIRTGLWKKEGQKGAFYSGSITVTEPGEYYISVFKNDRKTEERHPDLNLALKPKGGAAQKPAPKPAPKPADDPFGDGIPF